MVRIKNPDDYKFIKFTKSRTSGKKYDAILENKKTGNQRRIPFGSTAYQQYRDSSGLGLYSHLNHLDETRRANFKKRHAKNIKHKFSSGWFSDRYLW